VRSGTVKLKRPARLGPDDAIDLQIVVALDSADGPSRPRAEAPVDARRADAVPVTHERALERPDAHAGVVPHAEALGEYRVRLRGGVGWRRQCDRGSQGDDQRRCRYRLPSYPHP
jgi:hypothetical protein